MIVGLLFVSFVTATITTVLGIGIGMPLWLAFFVFPAVGSVTLLLTALLVYAMRSPDLDDAPLASEDPVLA